MKKIVTICAASLLSVASSSAQGFTPVEIPQKYAHKVDSVLSLMTLEEKVGQLNQYTGNWTATGPVLDNPEKLDHIKNGLVGSMLNIKSVEHTRKFQEMALESRLGIPMIFGLDVIHGMRTVYPIPLGEAASFDLDLMERTAAGAALETSAQGVHWTFAPMVDIARDARWGRVMEGAGEDTWYGTLVAKARVEGFQGESLNDINTIMACAKHFAAYGAAIAGKDYNTVDVSMLSLHDTYLPPFKAAAEAGVATFMNSFNDINGVPATGNEYIQRDVQKGDWDYSGFTVSDWGSIREMIAHGYVADNKDAAAAAIIAGCDMDMESRAYVDYLAELVNEGTVDIKYVDDAVRRVLLKKFELGLFDDPFRYCNEEREQRYVLCDELRELSREAGRKSVVLLKNEKNILPLADQKQKIAVVGALANSQQDMMGFWAGEGVVDEAVTLFDGLKGRYSESTITYSEGYDLETFELVDLKGAIANAKKSDVVIVAVGERYDHSGEAKSRADISVNKNHQQLVQELKKYCDNVVVVLMGGRPMIFSEMEPAADAILLTWWLGTEAGNAIADVLSGDYNPSGKLPMTFPAHLGQVPIYYNYKSTGRPESDRKGYTTCYQDIDFRPAYPFGFGLSYSDFTYSAPTVEKSTYAMDEPIEVKVTVKNRGKDAGREVVQLYIRDLVSGVTTPVKNLRAFQLLDLDAHQSTEVVFTITAEDLKYMNRDLEYVTDPGDFLIMVGSNSRDTQAVKITLQ